MPPRPAAPPPPPPVAEATQVIRTEPKPEEPIDIFDLAGVGDPLKLDPSKLWQRREDGERYRIPIGVDENQQPVLLDLLGSRTAFGVFGSTGSGRAPYLHSLLFGMATTHSPAEISFFCIGGSATEPTWNSITELPHRAAVQTTSEGLYDEHRLIAALEGELERRAQLLAGMSMQHFADYQAIESQTRFGPMPLLVVAVDMLPHFLEEAPGFEPTLGKLMSAGPLGVKLLFSAFGPDELPRRLAHRFGSVVLHTCAESDSRPLLGDDRALQLRPDQAYLVGGAKKPVLFRTAHANLRHPSSSPAYRLFADGLQHKAPPARKLLLPKPGTEPPSGVDAPLPALATSEDRGYGAESTSPPSVTIGTVDNPREHRKDPLRLDFTGADSRIAIVGRPGSGKTTAVLTTLMALALTSTPTEVRFHCLAFGGNGLLPLRNLPHSGAVVQSRSPKQVDQALAHLESTLDNRARFFVAEGIDSAADFRRRRTEADLGEEATDHFLVVDGWPEVHQHPGLAERVLRLARRGSEHGIHLIVTANRWDDLPRELRELVGGRVELRLTDPRESLISTAAAQRLPDEAGHCLHQELWGTINLPVLDDDLPSYFEYVESGLPDDLPAKTRELVARIDESWKGPRFRQLGHERTAVDHDDLPRPEPHAIPLGIDDGGEPVLLDLSGENPHLLITGGPESGKSTAIRTVLRGIASAYSPKQAKVLLIDYKREHHHALISEDHLLAWNRTWEDSIRDLAQVIASLRKRRGPAAWSGPELFVVTDDFHEVSRRAELRSLGGLDEFLPDAHEVGLHLVVAGNGLHPHQRNSIVAGLGHCAHHLLLKDATGPEWLTGTPAERPREQGEARLLGPVGPSARLRFPEIPPP
ncbi:type VII secretion protein EccCb [Saccharopolyspora kobensis]|uniref:DNA segregation ATPase FtsK/SpoIIIE, S-DNA-T family n=1 Tax=Saccharopolyspora kobensis TaxID=146035 RepID=A0A1H6D0H4_9PSEU|nr:type VII secretion protein EccCb [Saccharopolyspora kobensis]SEG78929.1 type VII secretion protein EccCb [Saccharopolyspora kobensis]SFD06700.1 DNA segregation ATPase FtsK/SpoIIIE, S-DNA-T family [Saccharopolyspora kobensis]